MDEVWKDIYFEDDGVIWDFRGLYQVSSKGNIKSLNYNHTRKEKTLKSFQNKNGYSLVKLYKDGKIKQFLVHRLVANMFITNDDKEHKIEVNHIDEDKTNNSSSNLEWTTSKQNSNHGTRNERLAKSSGKSRSKKVIGYSLTSTKVIILKSTQQAKKFDLNQSAICACCKGKYCGNHKYKGYRWYYLDDIKNNKLEEDYHLFLFFILKAFYLKLVFSPLN